MKIWTHIAGDIRRDGRAALVSVAGVKGSTPREAGARMVICADGAFRGTIGGGELEWRALAEARRLLAERATAGVLRRLNLGPDLGQCCGGAVEARIETFDGADLPWIYELTLAESRSDDLCTVGRPDATGRLIRMWRGAEAIEADRDVLEFFGERRTTLFLCGAGHVGRALALTLAPLPFDVTWIDPRSAQFPEVTPSGIRCVAGDPVCAIEAASEGALVVVMTHSHALDLAIVAAALRNAQLPYVGLIGSATKRARFVSQLKAAGFDETAIERMRCPIGSGLLRDKRPAAIALAAAVELMQQREILMVSENALTAAREQA